MKTFSVLLFSVFLFLLGCGNQPSHSTEDPKPSTISSTSFDSLTIHRIDTFFQHKFKSKRFNGNVLFRKGDKVFKKSYGYANFRKKIALNDSSRFQLASVSKPLTAVATMMLVQEGKINLEDSIQVYFPLLPYKNITVKSLLCHRSGLSNYMYITDDIWEDKSTPICNDQLIDTLVKYCPTPYYKADQRYNYSNTNYYLLARIIEQVTGYEFETWMAKHFFDPLRMSNSLIYSSMDYASIPNVAIGSNAYYKHKPDFYLNGIVGDKGVFSTTEDLMRLDVALNQGGLLSDSIQQLMYTPCSKLDSKGKSYGLGWRIRPKGDYEIIFHNGWWRGYRSYYIRIPKKDICIVVLTNTTSGGYLNQQALIDLISQEIKT